MMQSEGISTSTKTSRRSQDSVRDLRGFSDLRDFLEACAEVHGSRTAFSLFQNGEWNTISFEALQVAAEETAARLQMAGLKQGQVAAVLAESSIEWITYFFAIQLCGGIAVPLDIKLTPLEIRHILEHAEPTFIFTSRQFRSLSRELRHVSGTPAKVITIDGQLPYIDSSELEYKRVSLDRKATSLIVYTSGTSGAPKGVRVRAETLLFEAESLRDAANDITPKDVMFSMLPLNHLFGLTAGVIYSMICGIELCFAHSLEPDAILKCMVERRATQVLTVPLFLQMVKRGIERKVEEKGTSAELAFRVMIQSARHLPVAMKNRMFREIQARFGGNLRRFICGGSPLDPDVYDFFNAININVFEGYGLTETGPVIAVNSVTGRKKGTVGRPLSGVEVRIEKEKVSDESGEILTRGAHVMEGYHKNPDLTHEVLTKDGWFCTGDLGYFDEEGFLHITGRRKSLIVLSSGKKVHPEEVEQALARSSRIKNSCVVGLKDPIIGEAVVAVVLPSDEELEKFKDDTAGLERAMKEEVHAQCKDLVDFKRPARVVVRQTPFEMTSSQKVKRNTVLAELNAASVANKKA